MLVRYPIFLILTLLITLIVGFAIKPKYIRISDLNINNDPVKTLRTYYAGMVWKKMSEQKDPSLKLELIKRVLEYDPVFKLAYLELCENYAVYIRGKASVRDITRILKEAVERFDDKGYVDCYTGTMVLLERYDSAIELLEKLDSSTYDAKIKELKNEKNVLELTKAMEAYYKKNKGYPGDILVLVVDGYMGSIPNDPYGGQYFIGENGQIMSTSSRRS